MAGGERPADPPRRQGLPRAGRAVHGDGRRQIAGVAAVDARGEVAFLGVTGGDLGGCGGWGQRVFVGEHAGGGRRRGEAVVGPPRTIAIARRSGVPAKSLSPRCVLAHPWRSLRFLPVSTVSRGARRREQPPQQRAVPAELRVCVCAPPLGSTTGSTEAGTAHDSHGHTGAIRHERQCLGAGSRGAAASSSPRQNGVAVQATATGSLPDRRRPQSPPHYSLGSSFSSAHSCSRTPPNGVYRSCARSRPRGWSRSPQYRSARWRRNPRRFRRSIRHSRECATYGSSRLLQRDYTRSDPSTGVGISHCFRLELTDRTTAGGTERGDGSRGRRHCAPVAGETEQGEL